MTQLHAIIPAGGAGTRLWPLSRRDRPKFLLDLQGAGMSMLQQTVLRLRPILASLTIVTGVAHRNAVQVQIEDLSRRGFLNPDLHIQIVAEPSGRDSMAAIGLATYLVMRKRGEQAIVGSFAADHAIADQVRFIDAAQSAIKGADSGFITTIGIDPEGPSTAYGYIEPTSIEVASGVHKVSRFVEKPDQVLAQQLVAQGFLWNAGMFVMRTGVLADHLRRLHPDLDRGLRQLAESWGGDDELRTIERVWPNLKRISIDHAIAEPAAAAGAVATAVMEESGWSDVGDFASLRDVCKDAGGEGTDSPQLLVDAPGALIRSTTGKPIVIVGVPDAIVVDTEDAILVTNRTNAQKVKDAVDQMGGAGFTNLT